jgi:hypothetical protein
VYPEKTAEMSPWTGFELITLVVISTNCTGSCKFNCHTITTTTAPPQRHQDEVASDHCHQMTLLLFTCLSRGRRDRMVVGFTTTYVISAYHHWCCEFESRSGRGAQHYVIKLVSDLRQISGFLQGSAVSSTNKTDLHEITEILLKVTLNTIKQTNKHICHGLLTELV